MQWYFITFRSSSLLLQFFTQLFASVLSIASETTLDYDGIYYLNDINVLSTALKLNAGAASKPGEEDEEGPQQNPKCAKMLSQLLSNQAESTSNTMKVLSSLLQDDGCSLSSGEQQVAAKMMGKLMQGNNPNSS